MSRSRRLMLLAAAASLGCNDFAGPPTRLAGTYVASDFWIGHIEGANVVEVNQLIRGAALTITLTADGRTRGSLFVPTGNADGSDLVASMTGSWFVSNGSVYFRQQARTFMAAVPFVIASPSLRAYRWLDTTLVGVTLTRAPSR